MLELGIALLARLVVFAVLIEPRNTKPGTAGCGLSCLGVEPSGKRITFGQLGTIALQVIPVGPLGVHPPAQALIPNELDNADGFLNGGVLC
jgi:hypothetical protein